MTTFELAYCLARPFLLPLHWLVHRRIQQLAATFPHRPALLDVGGRKSHYTIGVPADVSISDLPRQSMVQQQKHLGINEQIIRQTQGRRSNIRQVLYDDMTSSKLAGCSYDLVTAIEVMEHVEQDNEFVRNVYRVLKPGGWFLMTTPNGEHFDIKLVKNADNKRFYTRNSLQRLLTSQFKEVEVEYSVPLTAFRKYGKRAWSARRPLETVLSMASNLCDSIAAARERVKSQAKGTLHLLAVARKD